MSFLEMKNIVFLSQKVGGNIIFTDYWKVLVLIILGMGNTVFFCAKKLMERWYLLITEKALFWTFRWWKTRSFLSQKVDRKMIFTGYWEVLVLNFSVMGNDIYLVFLSSPWYFQDLGNMVFRTVPDNERWKILLIVVCHMI